jgi:lipopolysaccharide biosynthesis regulator YciM
MIQMLGEEHTILASDSQRNASQLATEQIDWATNQVKIQEIFEARNSNDSGQNAALQNLLRRNEALGFEGMTLARKGEIIATDRLRSSQFVLNLMVLTRNAVVTLLSCVSAVWLGYTAQIFMLRRVVRRNALRAFRDKCVSCGYDLRGSSGQCPECGAKFERLPGQEPPTVIEPI